MENKDVKVEKNKSTVADKIWESIKDVKVNMFTLPDQIVSNYCSFTPVEPNKCYLTYTVSSILPALELALGNNYKVETAGRFITVSNITPTVG